MINNLINLIKFNKLGYLPEKASTAATIEETTEVI